MTVTKEQILQLRARTGAGVMDCRKALETANGDEERAVELLRQRGGLLAEQKAGRSTTQGVVGSYVHPGGRVAAMVLIRCETDFVARSVQFTDLARDLAMQVAAMQPLVVRPEEIPAGAKPADVALLAQPFIKDPAGKQIVSDAIAARVLEFGENIVVERFSRFVV